MILTSYKKPLLYNLHCYLFQNVIRFVQRNGLIPLIQEDDGIRAIKKCIIFLPLLPANQMDEGMQIIESIANESGPVPENIDKLLRYIQRQWLQIVTAEHLSVYGHLHHTNNHVESIHWSYSPKYLEIHRYV